MATLAALLLAPFLRRSTAGPADSAGALAQMFFLGAGFMLIETKAVVHMALLFGGTWIVNSVVFFAVLVMILLANLFVLAVEAVAPDAVLRRLVALARRQRARAARCVPGPGSRGADRRRVRAGVHAHLVRGRGVRDVVRASRRPDRAFGANVAGAMFGGLSEYSSMLLGFQYLLFVAVGLYVLSIAGYQKVVTGTPAAHIGHDPAG